MYFYPPSFQGAIGALFIHANIAWCNFRRISFLGRHPIAEVFVVTAVTALLNFWNPFTRQSTAQLLEALFDDCDDKNLSLLWLVVWESLIHLASFNPVHPHDVIVGLSPRTSTIVWLVLAAVAKLTLTTLTFGIKIPSGLFVPSLAVGACLARAMVICM